MHPVVFEHVPIDELPEAWRSSLPQRGGGMVTVRIEPEPSAGAPDETFISDDPAFGIWRDRQDIGDVALYVHRLRRPRYRPT